MSERIKNLIREVNHFFSENDRESILSLFSDEITYEVVGETHITGKPDMADYLDKMTSDQQPYTIEVTNIIIDGNQAVAEGSINAADGATFAFCDVYGFTDHGEIIIHSIRSYIVKKTTN